MAATQFRCKNQNRARLLANNPNFNGIDSLEVSTDQRTLRVAFFHDLSGFPTLGPQNVFILGGARIRAARLSTTPGANGLPGESEILLGDLKVEEVIVEGKLLIVRVNTPGDFSIYTLRLAVSQTILRPPDRFDPQLSEVDFSFKVDCPSDFDCTPVEECPPGEQDAPEINYLAKDYASFRRLILDRLSVTLPDWKESHTADQQMMLVELLAYLGDRLSYYQDAVATEAYLNTARLRTSVRRHARLLDYPMHDGCNARAWVCFTFKETTGAPVVLPERSQLLTRGQVDTPTIDPAEVRRLFEEEHAEIFETLHAAALTPARSLIHFYTWGDSDCCLPAGATRASLVDADELNLSPGDVLIFEEIASPDPSGTPDPSHRCAVRLIAVEAQLDELVHPATSLLNIEWASEDALPFPLCISAASNTAGPLSVARGNVVLVDHGYRIPANPDDRDSRLPAVPQNGARYRPRLRRGPVTQQRLMPGKCGPQVLDALASAQAAMQVNMQHTRPAVTLHSAGQTWKPQPDLLNSNRFQTEFVVETENDGSAYLRFGDNVLGMRPQYDPNNPFLAEYRIGNGAAGNVGAGAITRVALPNDRIERVWNPLPAMGGADPETLEQVRQFAPQAFRTQERAVTEADYVEIARRRADVQNAAAALRWTGSWYTAFVTIDRTGGRPVDAPFEQTLSDYLDTYRLAGYDIEINGPVFAPLDLLLYICVKPGYFSSNVKQALQRVFDDQIHPDGALGFFHPDQFTFGQPVYLSRIFAAAMAVDGVESVAAKRFKRWGKAANMEIENGLLSPGPFEVIRLDNDPNFPENGKLDFEMHGGL